jgi:hypothetical protein
MAVQQNGMRYNFGRPDAQETPLFERQMASEELIELQQMRVMTENLHQRIMNLEKINMDLEARLEEQARQSMAVERECMLIEQRWKAKNEELLVEIEKWKTSFRQEKLKGDRLREQVHRSERELYGILQRKYELMRGPGTNRSNPAPTGKVPAGPDGFTARRGELPSSTSLRDSDLLLTSQKVLTHALTPSCNILTLILSKPTLQQKEGGKSKEIAVLGSLSDFLGF